MKPKVGSVRVIVTSPGRNFAALKMACDGCIIRAGDATPDGRELATVSYI